ncbi:MAG: dTDP-4-dehydrorhamnose reductase [Planctomycetaceae bacterium]
MTIALIGATGQLGSELASSLGENAALLGRAQIEVTDSASVEAALSAVRPRAVINAAAYNLVDRAEDEPDLALAVNALGPRNVARYCAAHDIPLLHVSSDYVFGLAEDRNTPYAESDAPGPLSAYGTSKLAGEYFVRNLCRRHFIVRTCGLYGHNSVHGNFVETMLRLSEQQSPLKVVDDQQCTPTSTRDLARAILDLIGTEAYGLYHATNAGSTTWYRFAAEIFRLADVDVELIPITTQQFGAKARRPAYSVLDCTRLKKVRGCELPPWQQALAEYMASRP